MHHTTCGLDTRGSAGNSEQFSMLRQARGWIQSNMDRLVWWHRAGDDHRPNVQNQGGYKRMLHEGKAIKSNADHYAEFGDKMHPAAGGVCETEYFIVPEIFRKEICAGFDHRAMARMLVARGALMPEKEGGRPDRRERLPMMGNVRCYRLLPKLLSDE